MILLFTFHYKFATLLLGLAAGLIFLGQRSAQDLFKHIFYNAAGIILALGIFEAYLTHQEVNTDIELICEHSVTGESDEKLAVFDSLLGYKPAKEGTFRAIKSDVAAGTTVYDVTYNLRNHRRITPSSNPEGQHEIIFVGCSNTFGYGLADSATLPNQFAVIADSNVMVENWACNGYGCHQIYQQALSLPPTDEEVKIIYSFLIGHISRAAGYSSWDRQGPNFDLVEGELRNLGPFEEIRDNSLAKLSEKLLLKSRIYKKFFKQFFRPITDADIDRAAQLILATNRVLRSKGYEMYLFIHDIEEHIEHEFKSRSRYDTFIHVLSGNIERLGYLTDAIQDYNENIDQYTHGSCDRHPNELANFLIATHIKQTLDLDPVLATSN